MRLKFETHKLVQMDSELAIKKVLAYLQTHYYKVTDKQDWLISFSDVADSSHVRRNVSSDFAYFSKMKEGTFAFVKQSDATQVRLTFFVSVNMDVIRLIFILFFGIAIDHQMLFFLIPFSLIFGIKIWHISSNLIGNIMWVDSPAV